MIVYFAQDSKRRLTGILVILLVTGIFPMYSQGLKHRKLQVGHIYSNANPGQEIVYFRCGSKGSTWNCNSKKAASGSVSLKVAQCLNDLGDKVKVDDPNRMTCACAQDRPRQLMISKDEPNRGLSVRARSSPKSAIGGHRKHIPAVGGSRMKSRHTGNSLSTGYRGNDPASQYYGRRQDSREETHPHCAQQLSGEADVHLSQQKSNPEKSSRGLADRSNINLAYAVGDSVARINSADNVISYKSCYKSSCNKND